MSGVCGWIGAPRGEAPEETALDGMRRALRDRNHEAPVTTILKPGAALAAEPGVRPAIAASSGELLCALEGRVRWRDAEFARLAIDRGAAEALAEAYRRHGFRCLDRMSGPFALAIIDTRTANGLLAIDRLGTRTLCYAQVPGALIFGSNITSVVAHPAVERTMSRQAIFDYLYCHVIPSPGTIYTGVRKLQPGQCVTFRDGAVEASFYWRLEYRDDGAQSGAILQERLRTVIRDSVSRSIDGAANLGAFLSGGTDSSTVAAMLTQLRREPVRTYSLGFAWEGFDEMKYARITARHLSARAREYYVTPQDIVDAIPVIARAYDEPFGNDSAAPTYICARLAREDGIEVLLAGDGGDEIFGGNTRYAKQKLFETYGAIPRSLRRGLIEPLAFALPGHDRLTLLRKLGSYIRQASVPLPDRLETYNFLNRSPLAEIFEPDFLAGVDPGAPLEMLREEYRRTASPASLDRMMHLDLKITLADNDLRKVTRMCDVAGVEVRYPMLDDELVDFSGQIPAALKVKGLRLRWFFKQAFKDVLAPETLAKTKHGFGMPFGPWLKSHPPLAELVNGSLDAFRRRGILQPGYIDAVRRSHHADHATYFGIMIWVIAMLECWLAERGL
jgi:asparagine synthase (glutamine-hydrolysing)